MPTAAPARSRTCTTARRLWYVAIISTVMPFCTGQTNVSRTGLSRAMLSRFACTLPCSQRQGSRVHAGESRPARGVHSWLPASVRCHPTQRGQPNTDRVKPWDAQRTPSEVKPRHVPARSPRQRRVDPPPADGAPPPCALPAQRCAAGSVVRVAPWRDFGMQRAELRGASSEYARRARRLRTTARWGCARRRRCVVSRAWLAGARCMVKLWQAVKLWNQGARVSLVR
jgi:hypothetical protein